MMNTENNKVTFNEFCHRYCDGLYEPRLPYDAQCTGYKELRRMVVEKIAPATQEETIRWEKAPTIDEVLSAPDVKYMRFLHPVLREVIINNWNIIKNLEV